MTLSHQELVKLQTRIEEMGKDQFIREELRLRKVVVEKRRQIKDIADKAAKERYIANRKKEEEVRSELRTLMWAAHKTKNIAYVGDDIFWQDGIGQDFFDPYERLERLKDNDIPQIETVEALVEALSEAVPGLDVSMLRWFCYHRDVAETVHYRAFSIPKKSGGRRHIWAPLPKMKALQNWILRNILVRLPIHNAAHGFVHERSILTNAQVHTASKVVLSMDIKDFFPSLTFPRVKGIFRAMGVFRRDCNIAGFDLH